MESSTERHELGLSGYTIYDSWKCEIYPAIRADRHFLARLSRKAFLAMALLRKSMDTNPKRIVVYYIQACVAVGLKALTKKIAVFSSAETGSHLEQAWTPAGRRRGSTKSHTEEEDNDAITRWSNDDTPNLRILFCATSLLYREGCTKPRR